MKIIMIIAMIYLTVFVVGCRESEGFRTSNIESVTDNLTECQAQIASMELNISSLEEDISSLTGLLSEQETEYEELSYEYSELYAQFYQEKTILNVEIDTLLGDLISVNSQLRNKEVEIQNQQSVNDYYDARLYFHNINEVFFVESNHSMMNNWCVVSEDYFHIELLGHEAASKVEFWAIRLQSNIGPMLLGIDLDGDNGWKYETYDCDYFLSTHDDNFMPMNIIYAKIYSHDGTYSISDTFPIYKE